MRFVILAAVIVFFVVIVYLLAGAFLGGSAPTTAALEASARWEAHTGAANGVTTVAVRKVADTPQGLVEFGRQTIATIPDDAPDWETRYHEAMAQARSRVAALEAQSD